MAPVDSTGVTGSYSAARGFTLDANAAVPPAISAPEVVSTPLPLWTWTLPIGTTAVRYRIDPSVPWTGPSNPVATSFRPVAELADGEHTLELQAQGGDGAWSTSALHTIRVDTNPPASPELVEFPPDLTNNAYPLWQWVAADQDTASYRYSRSWAGEDVWTSVVDTTCFTPNEPLADGIHVFTVQAVDAAGNRSAPVEHTTTVDTTPPSMPTAGGPVGTLEGRPTWTWSLDATEPGQTLRVELAGGGNPAGSTETLDSTATSYAPASDLEAGTYVFAVAAADDAGNWSTPATVNTIVDNSLDAIAPSDGVSLPPGSVSFQWTDNAAATAAGFSYALEVLATDGTVVFETETTATDAVIAADILPEGEYRWRVSVENTDGTQSLSTDLRSLRVDSSAPTPPIVTAPPYVVTPRPTWSWTAPDATQIRVRYAGETSWIAWSDLADTTFTPAEDLAEGSYTLEVQAADGAGNWSAVGSATTIVGYTAPATPNVSGPLLTTNPRPVWQIDGDSASATLRYQIGGPSESNWTTLSTSLPFSALPPQALTDSDHTLFAQTGDEWKWQLVLNGGPFTDN